MNGLKRFGKFARTLFVTLSIVTMGIPVPALAAAPTTITVQPTPPPSSAPDLIITSIVGNSLPNYIELYNQGNGPINLTGWRVGLTIHDDVATGCTDITAAIDLPDLWLLSKKYLTLERTATPAPGALTSPFNFGANLLLGCLTPKLAKLELVHDMDASEQTVTIPSTEWSATTVLVAQHKQRGNSPSSTRAITGAFDSDYKFATGAIALNSDPLYLPPADSAGLQILEVLPNARSCAPTETDQTCNDYVKLYNPTEQPINLALYRLRIGYKGQSESVTNTFTWGKAIDPATDEFILPPLTYFMLTARNDTQPLSVTDAGNYIWLEDGYGTTVYDPVVQYPDASSSTKVGQAWAYDGSSWQWTSSPEPGAANYFPPIVTPPSSTTVTPTVLQPCPADQYRNPATNRCKSITVATTLTPCQTGEERNPVTNRCRSIVTASTTLTPCQPGQERNPATNRCRKVTTAVAGAYTTAVKDVAAPSVSYTGWFVAILAIGLALGYAIYEWRQELHLGFVHAKEKVILRFRRPKV